MRIIKNIAFCALILALFFSFTCTALQQEISVDSKINHVYIYPNSAMLTREAVLELDKGLYRIVFDDILEQFDENTIKAELENTSNELVKIKGVSVETVYVEEEPSIRIKQLQDEIAELEKKIRIITIQKNSLQDKKEFLNSIVYLFQEQKTTEDTIIAIPSTDQLEEIYTFLDEKLRVNYEQLLNQDFQIESFKDRIALLQKRLQQISNEQRETKKVIALDLEVYQNTNVRILVSYLLNKGINWHPIYDLKTDLKNDIIAIVNYALIGQSTGMDWENVHISLSTARPTVSGQLPPIDPWFLRPYQVDENIQKSVGMPMLARGELDAVFEDSITEEEDQLIPVEYKGTSVTYKIPQKVSIPSGTSREKVLISEDELSGQFNYRAYPRKSPFVYFNVYVENNLAIPLLPGEMNIFIEGGFTGNTSIGYIPPGNNFDISLGIAENLKVKRELVKKFRDETLIATIPSSKIATKYEYKITIENYQDMQSLCHIFESIPVSEDDRIQVNIDKISKEPQVKNWEDKEGIWMWEVLLEPQEKDEISFTYSIIHPRDLQIIDLP
jgi:uncharacterized protein (TIGR02231 family)